MVVAGGAEPAMASTEYGQMITASTTETTVVAALPDTEAAVRAYFSDIPVMIEVAQCESHFRHTLADGSVLRGVVDSRDVGVMQINTFYHARQAASLGLNLENLHDNMAYARFLYEKQGVQPWTASAPCWNRTVASL